MPLPLSISCSSKIQIGFTFLVPADPGSPGQRAVKRVCVCGFFLLCTAINFDFILVLLHYSNFFTTGDAFTFICVYVHVYGYLLF